MVLHVQPGLEQYIDILLDETGLCRDEIDNDTGFADLGIDRTLARAIIGKIGQVTHVCLPDDFFEDIQNVQNFMDHLEKITQNAQPSGQALEVKPVCNRHKPQIEESGMGLKKLEKQSSKIPSIIRLQGASAANSKNLFLMPDGSGSAMSYARIPRLGKDWTLYGLNSPHLGAGPREMSIPGLASLWTDKILDMQRHGPYILGGWSAGGYYITEVARLLLERGERVESLIIIDSPCRLRYGAPPVSLFEFLADKGLMGNLPKGAAKWLMDHFAATMAAVDKYHPAPVLGVRRVYIIEAKDGVLGSEKEAAGSSLDLSVPVTRMLLLRRGNDSVRGWNKQFPNAKLLWSRTSGNHFSLVHPPHVDNLGKLLQEAVNGDTDYLDDWSLCSGVD